MTTRARNSSRAVALRALPSEATAHISAETVSRLKAACTDDEAPASQGAETKVGVTVGALGIDIGAVRTKRGAELGARRSSEAPLSARSADGPFGVVCELSSGSTGTVYLAVDRRGLRNPDSDQFVAVKRLTPELTTQPDFSARFVEEMTLATAVNHPYVCKLLDFGRAGSSFYAASEFLQGEPLAKVMTASGIRRLEARSPRLIAHLIAGMAEGLHALHSLRDDAGPVGAIHGDVTPRNLFVLFTGSVRITDVGTAWLRDFARETEGHDWRGDLSYFSPERLEGRDLDGRSDVWALGVVMWELLTGQKLFRCGTSREAAVEITARRVSAPSEQHPGISPELDAIVLKALSRNRAKRHGSARELSLALGRYLESTGAPVRASEVADWLAHLFPTGEENRRELLQLGETLAAGMPRIPGAEAAAPASNAYPLGARDEGENTTHIFQGALRTGSRGLHGLSQDEPLTGVSLMDRTAVLNLVRPARRPLKKSWATHVGPFAFALVGAVAGIGLGALALAQLSKAHAHTAPPAAHALETSDDETMQSAAARAALAASRTRSTAQPVIGTPTTRGSSAAGPALTAVVSPIAPLVPAPQAPPATSSASQLNTALKPKSAPAPSQTAHSAATPTNDAVPQTGSVFLSTATSMDVSEQGRALGRAPGQFELSAGSHTLTLKAGADARTMTIRVPAGAAIVVSVPKNP